MGIEIMSKIRRFAVEKAGMSPIVLRATGTESLAVAQVESDGMEMARAGRRFMLGRSATVTGIAPFAAYTVTAQWVIWNNDYQKSYIFDHIGAVLLSTSAAGIASAVVMTSIFQTPAQTGANTGGMTVTNMSNGGPNSKAIVKSGLVAITTPSPAQWSPIAQNDSANTAALSIAAVNYDLRGMLIVPPQQGLGISVYSAVGTTSLWAPEASWIELEMDLE